MITEKAIELEKVPLGICKILRLLLNTLAADKQFSLLNRDNLMEPVQIILSEKKKACSQFFFGFSKFRLNFEYIPKIDNPYS